MVIRNSDYGNDEQGIGAHWALPDYDHPLTITLTPTESKKLPAPIEQLRRSILKKQKWSRPYNPVKYRDLDSRMLNANLLRREMDHLVGDAHLLEEASRDLIEKCKIN